MNAFLHSAHEFSPTAAGLLIASVWEGVLLTAAVALLLRLWRGATPAMRSLVWAAVLVLLVLLPVLILGAPRHSATAHDALHVSEGWSLAVAAAWAVLSLYRGLQLAGGAVRLRRLALGAKPVTPDAEVAALLAGPRRATLCVSDEVNRPSVIGFLQPRVLLPAGLLESLSQAELEHVVLHEMEHLRRRDDWLNLLQQISLVLLPLHPALLWLDRRLCRERELACDDGVLLATRAHRAYAACLVKLAEDSLVRKGIVLALSALGTRARKSELVGRVQRILQGSGQARDQGQRSWTLAGVGVAAVACAAVLAGSPQWVSFDAASGVIAQVSHPVLQRGTDLTPVRETLASYTVPTVRSLMAKAVVGDVAPAMRSASLSLPVRRTVRLRTVRRVRAPQPLAVRFTPVVQPEMAPVRPVFVPARMMMTEFELSQPIYAAVPLRDGWLILQL